MEILGREANKDLQQLFGLVQKDLSKSIYIEADRMGITFHVRMYTSNHVPRSERLKLLRPDSPLKLPPKAPPKPAPNAHGAESSSSVKDAKHVGELIRVAVFMPLNLLNHCVGVGNELGVEVGPAACSSSHSIRFYPFRLQEPKSPKPKIPKGNIFEGFVKN